MLALPPLALYIHIPWCIRKCPYCDFNSHEANADIPQADYIEALCQDFDQELTRLPPRELHSIFIGGGTPSLFEAQYYEKLLDHISKRLSFADKVEITLEANPGTVESDRFRNYRSLGINRLSLGIQSFDAQQLQNLGRIHDATEARRAIDIARQAGFDNINLDIMHALPGQSASAAMADLDTAIEFQPEHISWYQLTIEPNTHFYSRPPQLPLESTIITIQEQGQCLLARHGYAQYEVSAFAREGLESMHNLNYWQFGDYLGIGAGAHGKLTYPQDNKLLRTRKLKQPAHYLLSTVSRDAEITTVEESQRALEFLMNALRLRQGFSVALFEQRTGLPFSSIAKRVEYLTAQKLLSCVGEQITTTEAGYQLLNSLLEEFL
jgi:putative oxygen-independent coproporphyrinogen III oxidase